MSNIGKGDPDAGGATQKDIAGRANESRGPASLAEESYLNRAYPDTEVTPAETNAAMSAFHAAKARMSLISGGPGPGWKQIGPDNAVQPAVLNFTGHQYVTSGRTTALATLPHCVPQRCIVLAGAAGGGIWRTDNALAVNPIWKYSGAGLDSNAIGTIQVDPTDPTGRTVYVGTGEPNASQDSEAGLGLYKSTDGGQSWSPVGTSYDHMRGRSISSIAIDPSNPQVMYVGTTRGVRGISSVTGGSVSINPGFPPFGLWKTTDGGATWNLVWDGNASARGVNQVALDPANPSIVYASAFQQGIWRCTSGCNANGDFTRIYSPVAPTQNTDRAQFALTRTGGHTRMYVGDGSVGSAGLESRFFRSDAVESGAPTFLSLSSSNPADPGFGSWNFCTGQCWYDNEVYVDPSNPDTVWLLGSYGYTELGGISDARAVLRSTDAGVSFFDETADSNSPANSIHPDEHALAFDPNNPNIIFQGSDGGVIRTDGAYSDISSRCAARGLTGAVLARCQQLLSSVPRTIISLNRGLPTLQFQSILLDPRRPDSSMIGGTQDNGTWSFVGNGPNQQQTIYGDGGQSGFDASNPSFRFNSFFGEATDANFNGGDPTKWVVISGPLENSPEASAFYMPEIGDPKVSGTLFAGLQSVWRTTDDGGNPTFLLAHCPEFTTSAADPDCGDWQPLGGLKQDLTSSTFGASRAGGVDAAVERAPSNTGTLWAATSTGRVFITQNADAANPSDTTFTRLDSLASNSPGRFVSSIYVDPSNPNHAWISYSGYNVTTPTTPGHVFSVTYNPGAGTATWTDLSYDLQDLPITDLVADSVTGDLYAANDFGVLKLASGDTHWVATPGLPPVEVAGINIDANAGILVAATHGLGAWKLQLR